MNMFHDACKGDLIKSKYSTYAIVSSVERGLITFVCINGEVAGKIFQRHLLEYLHEGWQLVAKGEHEKDQ